MPITPIESAEDLANALRRIDALWLRKDRNKRAADELKVLAVLVEEYERRVAQIGPPTPVEAIRFRMDQLGLKTIQLAEYMGTTRARASEVLHGKRPLTLPMIRRLVRSLDLRADVLIGAQAEGKRSA